MIIDAVPTAVANWISSNQDRRLVRYGKSLNEILQESCGSKLRTVWDFDRMILPTGDLPSVVVGDVDFSSEWLSHPFNLQHRVSLRIMGYMVDGHPDAQNTARGIRLFMDAVRYLLNLGMVEEYDALPSRQIHYNGGVPVSGGRVMVEEQGNGLNVRTFEIAWTGWVVEAALDSVR